MSSASTVRTASRHKPAEEGRTPGRRSGLRRLGALFGSQLALVRREGELHIVLADRRRESPNEPAGALARLRGELRDRLLAHQNADTAHVMRHLVFVHDELGNGGWAGVSAFPLRVLRKALTQAEMLASEERSPELAEVIDKLRACLVAAELREERATRTLAHNVVQGTEVSEGCPEDFAQMERAWLETVSSAFTLQPMAA